MSASATTRARARCRAFIIESLMTSSRATISWGRHGAADGGKRTTHGIAAAARMRPYRIAERDEFRLCRDKRAGGLERSREGDARYLENLAPPGGALQRRFERRRRAVGARLA